MSNVDDGENGSQQDLDANMEDLDEMAPGDATFDSDEADDDIDEDEPSG